MSKFNLMNGDRIKVKKDEVPVKSHIIRIKFPEYVFDCINNPDGGVNITGIELPFEENILEWNMTSPDACKIKYINNDKILAMGDIIAAVDDKKIENWEYDHWIVASYSSGAYNVVRQ